MDQWRDVDQLKPMTKLETVYLERNPIWRSQDQDRPGAQDVNYRRKVMLALPWVKQIDATYVRA